MDTNFDKQQFAALLKTAMGERSINQYAMHSDVSPTYISRLLRCLVDKPPGALIIRKLADKAYNGVFYEEMMKAAGLIDEKKAANEGDISDNDMVKIPVYKRIKAEEPLYICENIEGYEYVTKDEAKHGDYFYLRITGDTMIGSRIYPGDIVYVRKQNDVDNGEIAVILNGEEPTLRRVFKTNGKVILQPDNSKYAPMLINKGDVRILGKAVHVKFEL